MQRLNAASCLLIALLSGAGVRLAAERLRVQVVQTHTGIRLGSCGLKPAGDSDSRWSRCNRSTGVYSRELGFHCAGPVEFSPAVAESQREFAFFYDVRVVMPDATQVVYHCSTILDANCAGFPEYPEGASVACTDFTFSGQSYKDCTASGPVAGSLGVYRASLHGDRMTIFGSNWRRNYLHYGTWQFDAQAAQDPQPPPQEPTPSPSQDNKPAPETRPDPSDTQPARKPDAKPDTPPGTKPDAAGTEPAQSPDPRPAEPAEAKPDAPDTKQPAQNADPKPDSPPETKPDPTETQPAPAPETKPAPAEDATVDANGRNTPSTAPSTATPSTALSRPSPAAEPLIDPRTIEEAKAGDMVAQYKLGYDYFLGRGVPIDYVQAAIWWKKSADQGYPQAQNNLGVLYNSGKGVPQSFADAYFWQNLAASRASGPLQTLFAKNRDESGSKLWLLSRLKVQQRAAKWATEHPVAPRSHEPPEEKRGQYP